MSEYMEKHNVSRLIGAPPGYIGYEEGGQLTEKIRRRPYSVVLLDEIEKAHPGRLEHAAPDHGGRPPDRQCRPDDRLQEHDPDHDDEHRRRADHRPRCLRRSTKKDAAANYEKMKEMLKQEMERNFRPEFLNRVDDIIVFRSLTEEDLKHIIDIELGKVVKRLKEKSLTLVLTDEAKELLIEKGTNKEFGARPLRRAIEHHLEDPLAEDLLRGDFQGKDTITVRVDGGRRREEARLRCDRKGAAARAGAELVAAGSTEEPK